MKLRTLLASSAAILATAVIAVAGFNSRQTDAGAFCLQESSGTGVNDRWCIAAGGLFDITPTTTADSAATNDYHEIFMTSPVDTTGTNTHNALTLDVDIGNATGGTNNVRGLQIDATAGDAQVTETAINVGAGWDSGFTNASPMTQSDAADFTEVAAADAGTTTDSLEVAVTTPVDTTGTNVHNLLTIDMDIGNASGGTNSARGIQIDGYTGDAQVTSTAINVGNLTGTGATENALVIGTGWDLAALFGSGVTLDDGTTASPDLTFQDATNETSVFSKVDAGNLTLTTDASDGLGVLVGNLFVGNGTPGETINGEDLYVEGISEFDGTANFDGAADFDGAITIDSTTVAENGVKFAGRGQFTVCGDIATVNNNTVYYGPSQAVIDSATAGMITCNTDEAGNTTEATADAPAVAGLAWVPLGMICYSTDMGATGSPLTYTLRAGAAYDSGAITLSIADNILSGASPANTIGTSAIAADTAVSVALSSGADVGAGAFICRISYAY